MINMLSSEDLLAPEGIFCVLVADDDAEVREALDAGLRKRGFAVLLAADGHDAVNVCCNRRAAIDVALLDVCMPALPGPETLVVIKHLDPDIPCCLMSGDLGEYAEADLHALGAAQVFSKPFRLAEVADALYHLAKRNPERARKPFAARPPRSGTSRANCLPDGEPP